MHHSQQRFCFFKEALLSTSPKFCEFSAVFDTAETQWRRVRNDVHIRIMSQTHWMSAGKVGVSVRTSVLAPYCKQTVLQEGRDRHIFPVNPDNPLPLSTWKHLFSIAYKILLSWDNLHQNIDTWWPEGFKSCLSLLSHSASRFSY